MNYKVAEINFGLIQKFLKSNILMHCVVLLLVLKIFSVAVSVNFPANIFFADITKIALENFANQARQAVGLAPLSENQKLNQAAQLKAENMIKNQYFAHTSPQGLTPWHWFLQAGYNYKYAGENLAIGFFDSKEVFNAWLNSPSHKANILSPNYKEVGTAVLEGFGANNAIVVVQEFGSQQPLKPVTAKTQKNVQPQTPVKSEASQAKPVEISTEQVLSQETESQNVFEPQEKPGVNNLFSRVVNSVLYNYEAILQKIIYGVSAVVIGALLCLIFFSTDFKFEKKLVFRALTIMILLSLSLLADRGLVMLITPHQITI